MWRVRLGVVWQHSPGRVQLGALLQVRSRKNSQSEIVVGLHCSEPAVGGGGDAHCILLLDGPDAGKSITTKELDLPGTIDVQRFVKILVLEPTPQPATGDLQIGYLYRAADGAIFMRARLVQLQWVCIYDPPRPERRGRTERALDIDFMLGKVALELIEQPSGARTPA